MTEETLFHEALGKPPGERAAFLDAACAALPELRAAVEALLAAHEASDSLLDGPVQEIDQSIDCDPAEVIATTAYSLPRIEPGIVIAGRYILQVKIGEGGMGEVWIAKQTEPVKRKIALKLIKTGMDSKAVLARFEQERQALALMEHPNIARILDGGLTPFGQPFFVMDLVNGLPLTKFCDESRLTPKERLELFLPICQAVQHAHQKGIVHRDLKPANILVTLIDSKPIPKVIDFGVAKAVGGKLTDESLSTQFGVMVGTLEYMSPEQAGFSAVDVDTRADVYSLGVILYELLTGLRPLDGKRLRKAAHHELLRIIQEEEPSKPSTRLSTDAALASLAALRQTEPKKLLALLRGELDWVVMKCLEKNRERRYETVNGLSRDVQRYLADEVVEARPPSAGYRLGKFLQRNKGPVVAGSLVLLALILGIVGTSSGLIWATRAEGIANQRYEEAETERTKAAASAVAEAKEREKAEQAEAATLADYRASTDDAVEQLIGSKPELGPKERTYLENTLKRWQAFAARQGNDQRSLAIRSEGLFRVAFLWQKLGHLEEARVEYDKCLASQQTLATSVPADPYYQQALVRTHNNLGMLLDLLGKKEEAQKEFQAGLDLLQQLTKQFPNVGAYQQSLGTTLNNRATLLKDLGKLSEAQIDYQAAMKLQMKLVAQFPDVPDYQFELARSHSNLGTLFTKLKKREYQVGRGLQKMLVDQISGKTEDVLKMGDPPGRLANSQAGLKNGDEGLEEFKAALGLQKKLVAQYPAMPRYRLELALTHINLGSLLTVMGKLEEAVRVEKAAIDLTQKLVEQFPVVPEYQQKLALGHNNLGILITLLGKGEEARAEFQAAQVLREKLVAQFPTVPEYQMELAGTHKYLGALLALLGNREKAGSEYQTAIKVQQKLVEQFDVVQEYKRELAAIHDLLGDLYKEGGKPRQALAENQAAFEVRKKLASQFPDLLESQQDLARSHNNLGTVFAALGKKEESQAEYQMSLAIKKDLAQRFPAVPAFQLELARTHNNLANLLVGMGKKEAARVEYQAALDLKKKLVEQFLSMPEYQKDLASGHTNLGLLLFGLGKAGDARTEYHKAGDILKKLVEQFPADQAYQRDLSETHHMLGAIFAGGGKSKEAIAEYEAALDLKKKLVERYPGRLSYQVELGGVACNYGNLIRQGDKPESCLPVFDLAIRTLQAILNKEPANATASLYLRNSHWNRALAYDRLNKAAQAVEDWDRTIILSPLQERPGFRATRANSMVQAGQITKAIADVAELTTNPFWNAGHWYDFACVYAIASGKDADKKQHYGDRAIELLQKAVKAGYKDAAHMAKDLDLDPLRDRDDFKKLLAELEKTPGTKQEKQP